MNDGTPATATALREVALLFLRLGATVLGGPAAHLAVMRAEVVDRRAWFTDHEFLDMVGAVNLIPGPNSTELAMHIGRRRAGWPGLVAGGVCFLLPAALLACGFAWLYVAYGQLPQTAAALWGVKPVVLAVIVRAVILLARKAVKSAVLAAAGVVAVWAALAEVNALLILLALGTAAVAWRWYVNRIPRAPSLAALGVPAISLFLTALPPSTAAAFSLGALFLFFLKTGSLLFGSGYVLLAFLRDDLVHHWHWLTEAQLLDAIAAGQVMPGPLSVSATFIGYLLGGLPGAFVATAGIFLPGFILVAISGPFVTLVRRSPASAAFLDGVNVASLALMTAVVVQLARPAVRDLFTLLIAVSALAALQFVRRLNPAWLMAGGVALGWLHAFVSAPR